MEGAIGGGYWRVLLEGAIASARLVEAENMKICKGRCCLWRGVYVVWVHAL